MWLPTSIYERAPQFWFLLGLLFIATGFYMGSEFVLSYWYIAVGFACCAYGVGIFLVRLRHRQSPKAAEQRAAPAEAPAAESEPAESLHSEPGHAG